MKVFVDSERCTGHARCHALAGAFYDIDDEGYSSLRTQGEVEVPPDMEALARLGAEACPERAISLIEG